MRMDSEEAREKHRQAIEAMRSVGASLDKLGRAARQAAVCFRGQALVMRRARIRKTNWRRSSGEPSRPTHG